MKVFTMLVLTSMAVSALGKDFFKPLKWEYRPLLIFSSPDDKQLDSQLSDIEKNKTGISERDIKIVILYSDMSGTEDGEAIDSSQVEDLYKKFDISRKQFTVILIGKDGGVKMRTTKNVPMNELFSIIDKMPMRQREMRN